MPGENYAFPRCHVSRHAKYIGIVLFKMPMRQDTFYNNWRNNKMLSILYIYRERNVALNQQVESGHIYFCERHFTAYDIEVTSKYNVIDSIHLYYEPRFGSFF